MSKTRHEKRHDSELILFHLLKEVKSVHLTNLHSLHKQIDQEHILQKQKPN